MEDVGSGEGLRKACKLLVESSNILCFIQEKVLPHLSSATTSDLSQEGVRMLLNLMMGQAQKLFYDKALRDAREGGKSMKPATLAKLSVASASHLKDAERFSSQLPLSNYCWTPPISFLALTME